MRHLSALLTLSLPLLLPLLAAAADLPAGTLRFKGAKPVFLYNFTINGGIYGGADTGFQFPSDSGDICLADHGKQLRIPISSADKMLFKFLGRDPRWRSGLYEVTVLLKGGAKKKGLMLIGNIGGYKVPRYKSPWWGLDSLKPGNDISRVQQVEFGFPPPAKEGKKGAGAAKPVSKSERN